MSTQEHRTKSRRDFIKHAGATTLAVASGGCFPAFASLPGLPRDDKTDLYDLLIRGGRVIDPSQGINQVLDVAIRKGKIVSVQASIPETASIEVVHLRDTDLVMPGLVDLHTHVYPEGAPLAVRCDDFMVENGSTTFVDAGDAGINNYPYFESEIMQKAQSRMFAFLNVSVVGMLGFPVGELLLPDELVSA